MGYYKYIYVIGRLVVLYSGKAVTEVLKMLARTQFFTIRADPKPVVSIFFLYSIFSGKLAYKRIFSPNFIIELAYTPSTNHS